MVKVGKSKKLLRGLDTKIRIRKVMKFLHATFNEYVDFHNANLQLSSDSKAIIELWCKHKNVPFRDKALPTKGSGAKIGAITNGKIIVVDFGEAHSLNHFFFWHEYAHFFLHFNEAGARLSLKTKEQEADLFAVYFCDRIFPGHYDSFAQFARDNPNVADAGKRQPRNSDVSLEEIFL